jgi:hypothetical protein
MTVFSTALSSARDWRKIAHLVPIISGIAVGTVAVALVAYLLWPTWGPQDADDPGRLPISVGGTLFNIPTQAIRMPIQRHSGPQERIDLLFRYPSLEPSTAPKHVSADAVEQAIQPVDQIFLSISAHHDGFSPDTMLRTIYPRYLEQTPVQLDSGLTMRAFRERTPYDGEDLFTGGPPSLDARCTRDASTPGMCLTERRIDGADLTFRFPRSWLAQWRELAQAMERLTAQVRGAR